MPTVAIYAAVAAFIGALVALLVYHLAVVRPTMAWAAHLLGMHDGLISGGTVGAADRLRTVEEAHASTRTALQSAVGRVDTLEASARTDLSRAGFVRYDAFSDAESGLSYALALLNREGDGVVLTSIYSRTDTRTFGKPVSGFKPTVQASAEELEAIDRARTGS
ncbi:MAG TPA: DUF4446 family protein [Candidatus Binatia bacterium]|nr:DUF4446 family protein [Candidatus Binatia bacterium]